MLPFDIWHPSRDALLNFDLASVMDANLKYHCVQLNCFEGCFRRVRFALAWRTVTLSVFYDGVARFKTFLCANDFAAGSHHLCAECPQAVTKKNWGDFWGAGETESKTSG
jgi:hypothetical protein